MNDSGLIGSNLIISLPNHDIYLCFSGNTKFYVPVSKKNMKGNITVELLEDIDKLNPDKNDSVWVNSNVSEVYKELDNYNMALVIPLYDDEIKNIISTGDITKYPNFDKYICNVISDAKEFLDKFKADIDSKVYLISSTNANYQNIITKFTERYSSRVEQKTIVELMNNSATNLNDLEHNMSFIVGKAEEVKVAPKAENAPVVEQVNQNLVSTPVNVEMPNNIDVPKGIAPIVNPPVEEKQEKGKTKTLTKEKGFISYYLLGIITVAVTLLVLYMVL